MPVFKKKQKAFDHTKTLILGFLIIIAVGTVLLFLPVSSKSGTATDIIDCFITAASATCVTGITVYDTFSHWSVFGQSVIMLLVQVGGLGFITLITFFNLATGKKLGIVKANTASSDISLTGNSSPKMLFTRIVMLTLIFEIIGALLLMIRFVPKFGGYGVFMAFFTSVSAFCNAGFDVMGIEGEGVGFSNYIGDPLVMLTLSVLIFIGGIGFVVWEDLIAYRKNKKLTFHSRIVLITSGILILIGTVVYFILTFIDSDVFIDYSFGERILGSFFGSLCTRSAGFGGIPMPTASAFAKLFTLVLMFVGAAPGSTGGGVKITTIAIIVAAVRSAIIGREEAQLYRHTINKRTVYKALTTVSLSFLFVFFGFFAVHLLNPDINGVDALYETVTCFSTTGISMGLYSETNRATQILLVFIMFAGRVGPASLMLRLGKVDEKSTILPQAEIMAG